MYMYCQRLICNCNVQASSLYQLTVLLIIGDVVSLLPTDSPRSRIMKYPILLKEVKKKVRDSTMTLRLYVYIYMYLYMHVQIYVHVHE